MLKPCTPPNLQNKPTAMKFRLLYSHLEVSVTILNAYYKVSRSSLDDGHQDPVAKRVS